MAKEASIQHNVADYNTAVQTIKEAILRSHIRQRRWSIAPTSMHSSESIA